MPSLPLRSLSSPCSWMPCVLGEVLLLELELRRQVQQAHLALFFRHHLVKKCQVVAEELDGVAIVHRHALADEVLVEDRRHRGDVLVREAQVHAGETGIARLHVAVDARPSTSVAVDHVPREDLLRHRHGPRLGGDRRHGNFALHARDVERKQPAVLDDLARDLVLALGKHGERNLVAAADAVNQAKNRWRSARPGSGSSACKCARCFPRSPTEFRPSARRRATVRGWNPCRAACR